MSVPFTAPGYHTVTPSLTIRGAAEALEFYTHKEDVSPDEIDKRAAAWMKAPPDCKS